MKDGEAVLDINDTIIYKERQDLSRSDKTIEYIRVECQGKSNKNYLVAGFYQPCL